ncbi:MAG: hypothetical protein HRU14_03250 [Planctomycetes bacterium]|nr:hypothetical protein [Planctomycetota bacterium]
MRYRNLLVLSLLVLSPSALAQLPIPTPQPTVDVEVAYVKYFTTDLEELEKRFTGDLAEATKGIKVRDKEMFPRWKANKVAYRWIGDTTKVRNHVVREIKVAKLLTDLMVQVKADTDFEKLAKESGLSFHRYEKADRRALQLHKDIGSPRAVMMLWGSGIAKLNKGYTLGTIVPYETKTQGVYWPKVFDEPGNFMAIFRLVQVHPPK